MHGSYTIPSNKLAPTPRNEHTSSQHDRSHKEHRHRYDCRCYLKRSAVKQLRQAICITGATTSGLVLSISTIITCATVSRIVLSCILTH